MACVRKLCADKALTANDVPDAWLAAAALHQGEHVVSFDGDFKRLLPRAQFTRLTVLPATLVSERQFLAKALVSCG